MSPTYPEIAITKSITFHPCLRYEYLWMIKPIAIILVTASTTKIMDNIESN